MVRAMSDDADKPDDAAGGAETEGRAKKERVLHTRVPAVLEQELKRLAESWRIPVSNVVRTILEDAIDALDTAGRAAEGEIRGVAEKLAEERRRLREPLRRADAAAAPSADANPDAGDGASRSDIAEANSEASETITDRDDAAIAGALGFTPMVLANDARCAVTGRALRKGEPAYLVLFAEAGRTAIVCDEVARGRA